jgi:hypothetical protein
MSGRDIRSPVSQPRSITVQLKEPIEILRALVRTYLGRFWPLVHEVQGESGVIADRLSVCFTDPTYTTQVEPETVTRAQFFDSFEATQPATRPVIGALASVGQWAISTLAMPDGGAGAGVRGGIRPTDRRQSQVLAAVVQEMLKIRQEMEATRPRISSLHRAVHGPGRTPWQDWPLAA